jgi:hypothetical protein
MGSKDKLIPLLGTWSRPIRRNRQRIALIMGNPED